MKREIEFRAWEHDRQKMCYGYQYNIGDAEQNNYTLMQKIGIKDIKGKEIFEGDILSLKKEASLYKFCPITIIGFVQYVAGKYEVNTVKCINPNVNNTTSVHFGMKVMDWIHLPEFYKSEIIGNIYENPELVGDVI
jgi:uncharacterized phage protein (TIGR01671 family)